MVVHDHVAVLDLAVQRVHEAADVPGQRADVHRCRVRLAKLPTLRVEDPRAEVLRLADDRRVAHPEEHAGHLFRDRVEGTAEHPQRDRVDLEALASRRSGLAADLVVHEAHRSTPAAATSGSTPADALVSMTMLPKRSMCAEIPGGTTVVESY